MISREFQRFLVVGALTVVVDFISYSFSLWALAGVLPVAAAKATGFIAGTFFAYFANRQWTFESKQPASRSLPAFAFVYVSTLGINLVVNGIVLNLAHRVDWALPMAFLVATAVSAALNFAGMRWLVFRPIT